MIPAFNCANYLRKTLESVLAQDPGPEQMQIEVVDDCSFSDDPEAVVREIGKGRVQFYRKSRNEGVVANFNTCLQRSRGELIHILHGDDCVLPGFYREIHSLSLDHPNLAFFATRHFTINESDVISEVSQRVPSLEAGGTDARAFHYFTATQFCSTVIRRSFYEAQGGFMPELVHTADCEMWTRAIALQGGIVSTQVLSCYRNFEANDTGRLMRSAENIRDLERLHSVLAKRFEGFSLEKGRLRSANLAWSQAEFFEQRGEAEAAEANYAVWRELATTKARKRAARRRFTRQLKRTLKSVFR
ncbi:MAG: glycosyltransferase family A protein [Verrucomicrobiales bacterium]